MTTLTPAAAQPSPVEPTTPGTSPGEAAPPPGTPGFDQALDKARTATAEGQTKTDDKPASDDAPTAPVVDPTQLLDTLAALTVVAAPAVASTAPQVTGPAPVPVPTAAPTATPAPPAPASSADPGAAPNPPHAALGAPSGGVTDSGPNQSPAPTAANPPDTAATTPQGGLDATELLAALTSDAPAAPAPASASASAATPAPATDMSAAAPPAAATPATASAPATPVVHHAAPSHRPEPVPAAQLGATIERLHDVIQLGSRGGSAHAHLQLHPVELGTVDVRLRTTADGVVATIKVHDAAALTAVTQAGNELKESLTDRGINVARLDVSLTGDGDRQAQGRRDSSNRNPGTDAIDIDDTNEEATVAVALTATGLVDVHA